MFHLPFEKFVLTKIPITNFKEPLLFLAYMEKMISFFFCITDLEKLISVGYQSGALQEGF